VQAVTDFNLEIADREFVVLVGPSGCGKSTVLRMIAGLEDVTDGEIYIGGELVNGTAPRDRDVAMVFQSYALYPHMTVFDNIAYGLKLRKTPRDEIESRVRDAAAILKIEHLLERRPKALSGGERQRVALGRAMVRKPAAFLFDEPLSNLDAKLRASMRTEIKKLHERLGATFVFVTHDQTEAMTMGDRIVAVKDGRIMQTDPPGVIYGRPRNVFTAGFIGSPPMNFFEGEITRTNAGFAVSSGGDAFPLDGDMFGEHENLAVTVGIRPEDLSVDLDKYSSALTATVEVCESLGSEVLLHADYGGAKITARLPANETYDTGDTVRLAFDTQKLHLFDALTQEAIL
jgi:multiple sugar transport system ATP-binding protein